jgi:hypothetical protein
MGDGFLADFSRLGVLKGWTKSQLMHLSLGILRAKNSLFPLSAR